ncbi:hypothetical protein BU15DRAFT_45017 [Melanogaster broomeanus]|nr:hypothetical protein BU15DRAFT_45017 [Melanogaster broomeanus]
MLLNVSKGTTVYLTPVLMLTSLFLILFAYLAPAVMLHSHVSLLTVTPYSALAQPGQAVDGPSMLEGMLGSCSKPNNVAGLTCTSSSFTPVLNTSVFTSNTPTAILAAPPAVAAAFLAISLALSIIFFFMLTAISFRHLMGKRGNLCEKPMFQEVSAWIGISSFVLGLGSFLVVRMYFGKAAADFNLSIQGQGTSGPQLIASTSNGFTMVWIGYAFFAIPVVVSLAKLHVLATKK